METDMSDEEIEALSEFKSYYVVWKLGGCPFIIFFAAPV